jgi:hypothetical protein
MAWIVGELLPGMPPFDYLIIRVDKTTEKLQKTTTCWSFRGRVGVGGSGD